jgi:hypothetical protein
MEFYVNTKTTDLKTRITETDSAQRTYIDSQILSLGAYYVNIGVGTFPIYGSMNDFSLFGLNLYIKGEKDSFIIMPYYSLFIFSEINQGGKYSSMVNLSNNIEYYNISPLFRVKSCTLYKYNQDTQAYELVNTVNNINPEITWN